MLAQAAAAAARDTVRIVDTLWVAIPPSAATFWDQFLPNLAATFAGVIFGVLGALGVDRYLSKARRAAGRQAVLEAYRHAVTENGELCNQLLQRLSPSRVVFFSLNVGLFDALAEKALDAMNDLPLLQRLNGFHFQLGHLNRKLDTYVERSLNPTSHWHEFGDQLFETIFEHAGVLRSTAQELLQELDRELGKGSQA